MQQPRQPRHQEHLQTNLNALITRLDTTVGELKMADINAGITNLLASVNRLVTAPDITNDLAALRPTLDQYRELGAKVTSKIDPLADSITNSLAEANRALAQFRGAGENLRTMLAPDSPLRNDLDQALQQLAGAAQSIVRRSLDFLKQHPNALITGREHPKKNHECKITNSNLAHRTPRSADRTLPDCPSIPSREHSDPAAVSHRLRALRLSDFGLRICPSCSSPSPPA